MDYDWSRMTFFLVLGAIIGPLSVLLFLEIRDWLRRRKFAKKDGLAFQ